MPKLFQFHIPSKSNPTEADLISHARKEVGKGYNAVRIVKKSLDARGRSPYFIIQVEAFSSNEIAQVPLGFELKNVSRNTEVFIVGCGPAGLFAALQCIELGLKPIVIERGKSVRNRRRDLAEINRSLQINPESNYCFGEGGAGTYSDGKLYTRSKKRGPVEKVLAELIKHGAASNIAYDAHPHIGTNKLPGIIENITKTIQDCGGEVLFEKKMTGLILNASKTQIEKIEINHSEKLDAKYVLLATGHSARDIFQLLHQHQILIESKPFALGVRVEHPQNTIDNM